MLFLVDTFKRQDKAISNPNLSDDDIKKVRKIIQDVLTQSYSDLSTLFSASLQKIATDMFSQCIISESTKAAPTFSNVMTEFQSGMIFIHDIQGLEKHCVKFLNILVKQGGGYNHAANSIAENWRVHIKEELNINIGFDTK